MRRLLSSILVAFGCAAAGATGASAAPAPAHAGPPAGNQVSAKPGKKACTVTDERLDELSGIVARKKGYVVINDGSDRPGRNQVFFLDAKCQVTDAVPYSGNGPRDTEDLVLSPDGKTLWIGDIGDNNKERQSVALWSMPADGSKKPVINRAVYPDGAHDAEALLVNGDGTPIIVTKEAGRSRLYVPATALKPKAEDGVPLKLAGEVKIPASSTSNPFSIAGRLAITGGAVSPDGTRVVLRTYADAFEWDVSSGDVLGALKSQPRMTPLPDEPWGEAVAYTPDGRQLVTVSDFGAVEDEDAKITIQQYVPVANALKSTPAGAAAKPPAATSPSWFDRLTLQDITYLIGGVGVLGAVLVVAGIVGILRARRRPAAAVPAKPAGTGPPGKGPGGPGRSTTAGADPDAQTALLAPVREPVTPAGGPPARAPKGGTSGAVYGSGSGSGVYGGRPAAPAVPPAAAPPPVPGGVYGGGQSPRVYGSGAQYRPGADRGAQNGNSARIGPGTGFAGQGAGVYGRSQHTPPGGHPDGPGRGPLVGR